MASKDEIIAAASRLFVEKGFENTTMRDIAETVGIYKGSLYHHIRSKADLFHEILDMSLKESSKTMREVRSSDLEPEQKFRKIILVHFENILNFSLEYQILLNERRHMLDEQQEARIRAQMKTYENHIVEVLKEGISAKVFRDDLNPRVVVAGIMAAGNAVYKWFSPSGPLTFEDIASTYVELFIHGLKTSDR
jgi:TetR/AcrR family transcriptional regulator, cholesterol catabolism regulator